MVFLDTRDKRTAIIWGFALLLVFFGLFTGRVNLLFFGDRVYEVFSLYAHATEIGQFLCLFLIGAASLRWRRWAESLAPYVTLILLVSGYVLTLYQAIEGNVPPALSVVAGGLFGAGQGACFMCWLMVYSRLAPDDALRCMVKSTVLSAAILLAIGFIPSTTALFSALSAIVAGGVALMFYCLQNSGTTAKSASAENDERSMGRFRFWFLLERRSLLCLIAIAFVCGAQRVVSLEGFLSQQAVQLLFSVGYAIGALAFWGLRRLLGSDKNFYALYSALLVIMATCGVLSAIQDANVQTVLYAIDNIAFDIVSMCMVATTLRAIRDVEIGPLFFAGVICGTVYFAIQFGRIVCGLVSETVGMNATGILVISVIIIYVVALASVSSGAFFRKVAGTEQAKNSSQMADDKDAAATHRTIISIASVTEEQLRGNPVYHRQYNLTDREIDMAILLLAGYNSSDISKALTISVNTVKTHLKNLYAKMGVHNRRELIELLNEIEYVPSKHFTQKGF